MKNANLLEFRYRREYENKIKAYSYEKLMKEKQKLNSEFEVLYTYMGSNYYSQNLVNISDNNDEIKRICWRKKIPVNIEFINNQLKKYGTEFSKYWGYINKEFMKTTTTYDYVEAKINGKPVALEDKLNFNGLVAYTYYLYSLSEALDDLKNYQMPITTLLKMSVGEAVQKEQGTAKDFPRDKFYTRNFLSATSAIKAYKKFVNISIIDKRLEEIDFFRKMNNEENLSK